MTVYPNLNLLDGTATFDMNPNISNNSTVTKTKIPGITNTVMDVKTSGSVSSVGFYTKKEYNITEGQIITISFMARGTNDTNIWVGFQDFPGGVKDFKLTPDWKLYTYTFKATKTGTALFYIYGWNMVADQWFQAYNIKVENGSTATPWMPSASEATAEDYPSYIGAYADSKSSEQSTDPARYSWKKIE